MLRKKALLAGLGLAMIVSPMFANEPGAHESFVYIGTQGESIVGARFDSATGHFTYLGGVTQILRPTWLDLDPKRPILYSVSEIGNYSEHLVGSVYSLAIDTKTGALKQISNVSSEGHGPTFLSYDSRVNAIFVAHYGHGRVVAIPVRPDGTLSEATSLQTDYGVGANKAKQPFPHAHAAVLDPGGHFVVTPDMGTDRIFVYKYDSAAGALSPANTPYFETGPGTGPRHIAFSSDGRFLYALMELTAEVRVFSWDSAAGLMHPIQAVSINPSDFKGTPSAAEIGMSPDGRFLYTSNRGTNSLQVFAVDKSTGKLEQVQDIPSGGTEPRSFAFDPSGRWMLVANQVTNTIAVFAIDNKSGKLSTTGTPIPVASTPARIVFYQP